MFLFQILQNYHLQGHVNHAYLIIVTVTKLKRQRKSQIFKTVKNYKDEQVQTEVNKLLILSQTDVIIL